MGLFEEELKSKLNPNQQPFKWYRYIDDIWGLWTQGEEEFLVFVNVMNSLYPGVLEFAYELSDSEVCFLDLRIKLEGGLLATDLYTKPSNLNLYLHYDSYHSNCTKKGIVFSQALRIKMICSDPEKTQQHFGKLRSTFLDRGYPSSIIDPACERVQNLSRKDLLSGKGRKTRKPVRAPLVVTRNPRLPNLRSIINKHFHILQLSPNLMNVLPSPPQVIYRQPGNLQSHLVTAKLVENVRSVHKGCYKTHFKNCVTCNVLQETDKGYRNATGERFTIFSNITCTSIGVVYLINCKDCGKQYVGETGDELRVRHCGHRQEIRKGNTPLGQHFQICNNFELIGLQSLANASKHKREAIELRWIYRLGSLSPVGISVKDVRTVR